MPCGVGRRAADRLRVGLPGVVHPAVRAAGFGRVRSHVHGSCRARNPGRDYGPVPGVIGHAHPWRSIVLLLQSGPAAIRDEGPQLRPFISHQSGDDLLSQGPTPQVPSALAGLTSVFGMGTGGSPPLSPPEISCAQHPEHSIASTHVKNSKQALDRLVPVSFTHCCASTSGLSTWCSARGLNR